MYRSITRFRPDLFLSSSAFIDRDAWSKQNNWLYPRAVFVDGELLLRPYVMSQSEKMDFIVMPATEQWDIPWSDQMAFGGRDVMQWYLTTLNVVDSLTNFTGFRFFPESLLGVSLRYQSHKMSSRKLCVYTPKDLVTCICRQVPCSGDCSILRSRYNYDPWNNLKLFVRRRLCRDEFLNTFLTGRMKNE